MKKLKVLMMGGMLAAGICLFAACGTANDDAKLLIGNYSKQKEEMLQAYEARVYAYHV